MKVTSTLTSLLFVVLHASCGQSEEEKAKLQQQQQAREDSIKHAAEEETKSKIEAKQALQDSLQLTTTSLSVYQATLMEAKANLEAARDKMNSIKEFQLGRTPSEREEQIKNQSMTISSLEEQVKELEKKINETEGLVSQLKTAVQNSN